MINLDYVKVYIVNVLYLTTKIYHGDQCETLD